MRSLSIPVLALLLALPAAAQPLHQATPVDQLLREFWAAHPEAMQSMHQHHESPQLIAEMEPIPKAADAVTVAATKSFTVVAKQFTFTFSPSPFVVNQGDSVTLDLTSSDVTHGFFLEQYFPAGVTIAQGQHKTITFVANTPGSFTYACTVPSCGSGHSNMVGTLTVTAAANPPSITSFTPHSGPAAGGTVVAITGTNFQNGATVKFGDSSAVSVTINSSTSINAISPAHTAGDVSITVTNPDGQSASSGTFTYAAAGPSIGSIAPSSGSTAGGTAVTIAGSNFATGATVTIGGIAASNVNVVNATTITASTPAGPFDVAGSVTRDVVVTNPDGRTATMSGGFTYTLAAPTISAISPSGSTPTGGTAVVITGSGFTTGLPVSVTFGGIAGSNVQVTSPTSLIVVAPPHAIGPVDVVVSVGSARFTAAAGFSYQTPGKKRRAVTPR